VEAETPRVLHVLLNWSAEDAPMDAVKPELNWRRLWLQSSEPHPTIGTVTARGPSLTPKNPPRLSQVLVGNEAALCGLFSMPEIGARLREQGLASVCCVVIELSKNMVRALVQCPDYARGMQSLRQLLSAVPASAQVLVGCTTYSRPLGAIAGREKELQESSDLAMLLAASCLRSMGTKLPRQTINHIGLDHILSHRRDRESIVGTLMDMHGNRSLYLARLPRDLLPQVAGYLQRQVLQKRSLDVPGDCRSSLTMRCRCDLWCAPLAHPTLIERKPSRHPSQPDHIASCYAAEAAESNHFQLSSGSGLLWWPLNHLAADA
jgi:hypothetical protein